jgi:hypothetical protein
MMKKRIVLFVLLALLPALVLSSGCGENKGGDAGNGTATEEVGDRIRYDEGFEQGREEGYAEGYSDGEDGIYEPEAPGEADKEDQYTLGYNEGWAEGYADGHADAVRDKADAEKEMAEVEAAMIAFVKQNAAPGLEFRIENLVIHGDEAAGIAVCTSEVLESPLVVMRKSGSGWEAVDFGTGIEPPSWYQY